MPKAKGKGGKNRRRGKGEGEERQDLVFKEDGQEYGQVLRMLGNGRLEVQCFDGVKRMGHIRGKLRKKVWIATGDVLLVGLRDFQDVKCDVILRYTPEEARRLIQRNELPEGTRINEAQPEGAEEGGAFSDDEGGFTFDDI